MRPATPPTDQVVTLPRCSPPWTPRHARMRRGPVSTRRRVRERTDRRSDRPADRGLLHAIPRLGRQRCRGPGGPTVRDRSRRHEEPRGGGNCVDRDHHADAVLVKDIEYRRTTPAERQGPPRARRTNRDVGDWTNIVYVHTAPTPDPATKSNRAIMSFGLLSDEEAQYEPSTRTDDANLCQPLGRHRRPHQGCTRPLPSRDSRRWPRCLHRWSRPASLLGS